ncbi:acyl-ACP--UDP-N- acetylglucosamine O-acyltransferase [Lysinibacter sp. HNR]|uniref:acyl-ACP--UDP-N- acetylglucosamine O-acyltransferase n=1 Tax=Lysinibacter sp. HNR TaxID=3031408 RepID=UPI002435E9A4|nr:acyl-ACP--UDP-N- acetylglucosamine O-acyltransferase [Lysinibacter sp. HNR]WGD38089.1 acyl-ACP--UDP-N- acetylglucosamine O-acyltransferase [Lysinibacter sp. HNR]
MNSIHPTAIIQGDITIGTGNVIGPFAVVTGPLVLGNDNWIGAGTFIGSPPEVRSWQHPTETQDASSGNGIIIGSGNVIREGVQIHQGWRGTTRVGNDCFIMNQSYIAHDCNVGDSVTMASSVLLAGHVVLGEASNLGLGVKVHQHRYIGQTAMVGMGAVVTNDVLPCVIAYGVPAKMRDVNSVGMERRGYSGVEIAHVRHAIAEAADQEEIIRAFSTHMLKPGLLSSAISHWEERNGS